MNNLHPATGELATVQLATRADEVVAAADLFASLLQGDSQRAANKTANAGDDNLHEAFLEWT
jgi:hypothetical protein